MTARPAPAALMALAISLAGCGSGGDGPTNPPPVQTFTVGVAFFYDENGNGTLDATEGVRVPDVLVDIGGRQGRSAPVTAR